MEKSLGNTNLSENARKRKIRKRNWKSKEEKEKLVLSWTAEEEKGGAQFCQVVLELCPRSHVYHTSEAKRPEVENERENGAPGPDAFDLAQSILDKPH